MLEDVSVNIPVLRNDYSLTSLLDTSTLAVIGETDPAHGTVEVISSRGFIKYTPDADFFGIDSFVYQICSQDTVCQEGRVNIIIHPVDDPPQAADDTLSTLEDQALLFDLTANDRDPDVDSSTTLDVVDLVTQPRHGNLVRHDSANMFEYTPDSNYFGPDYFTYRVCDDTAALMCDTASVSIRIMPVNDPPHVEDDRDTTWAGIVAVVQVLANDHDGHGEVGILDLMSLTTEGLAEPRHGYTFVDNSVGMILYIPDEGFSGSDQFEYRVCDMGGEEAACAIGVVEIVVLPGEPPGRR